MEYAFKSSYKENNEMKGVGSHRGYANKDEKVYKYLRRMRRHYTDNTNIRKITQDQFDQKMNLLQENEENAMEKITGPVSLQI